MRYLFAFLLCFAPLIADKSIEWAVLQEGSVHAGDYFVRGGNIKISGVVQGDVYAVGGQIQIPGIVEGDVIAIGANISVSGRIQGNARLIGAQIEIDGTIDKNLTTIGANLEIRPRSKIGGSAVLNGGGVDLSGSIAGNVTLTASTVRLFGNIGKNVRAYVGTIRIGSRASIGGNFEYSSNELGQIDPGARIKGKIIYHQSAVGKFMKGEWKKGIVLGARFTGALMNFLFSFVIGWIIIRFSPKRLKNTLAALDKSPWKAFWTGLLTFLLLPLACILLLVTVLGVPFALALATIGLLTFYTAKIFPILWLCNKISPKKPNRLWAFAIGIAIFLFVSRIAIIGGVVRIALTFLGLGALVLGRMPRKRKRNR